MGGYGSKVSEKQISMKAVFLRVLLFEPYPRLFAFAADEYIASDGLLQSRSVAKQLRFSP